MKVSRLFLFLLLVLACAAGAQPVPGWRRVEVPATGSYSWRYVPQSLDASRPAPVVLFFHGAGSNPDAYRNFVSGAAENAGCVVAMPKSSSGIGWGTAADEQTVVETLRLVGEELPVDDRRIAVAGHSAGGAFAYLLAYAGSQYSAVFTLAAPFYPVGSPADAYKPPIRMYYGTTDPNYTGGAYDSLKAQWNGLGISWEEDVQVGWGHNSWPNSSMANGFLFLMGKSRPAAGEGACVPTAASLCLSQSRFRVEVTWEANASSGTGKVVPGASADSGLFWFFSAENWELMVKVLNGCAVNDRYWVFAAASTTVHYVLTVTDTSTGRVARYENPAGRAAAAITDTSAFATCP